MSKELSGIPPRYGTKNCYDCGKEPPDDQPFWERFVELHGEHVSVPNCDECSDKFYKSTSNQVNEIIEP